MRLGSASGQDEKLKQLDDRLAHITTMMMSRQRPGTASSGVKPSTPVPVPEPAEKKQPLGTTITPYKVRCVYRTRKVDCDSLCLTLM